jgi:hypothetical protein
MRNMSFSMTTEQMRNRTKTVTRRFGWWFLKAGDRVRAVEKAMGLKKGEKIKPIYVIEIVSLRVERLCDITESDCTKEGFPLLTPNGFVDMMMKKFRCKLWEAVNRIEFREVK